MVAVEVDGTSHHSVSRRESDERKESFLRSQGWNVLRFQNERILSDLEGVYVEIASEFTT
jgi:very-short-patch-repair endonuclease